MSVEKIKEILKVRQDAKNRLQKAKQEYRALKRSSDEDWANFINSIKEENAPVCGIDYPEKYKKIFSEKNSRNWGRNFPLRSEMQWYFVDNKDNIVVKTLKWRYRSDLREASFKTSVSQEIICSFESILKESKHDFDNPRWYDHRRTIATCLVDNLINKGFTLGYHESVDLELIVPQIMKSFSL